MKRSASSRDPIEASNEDASPIRVEESLPFLVPDAVCLAPCLLHWTGGGRMKGDRKILVGIHPCELEFRFASCNV